MKMFLRKQILDSLEAHQNVFQYCPRIYAIVYEGHSYCMREFVFAGQYKTLPKVFDKRKRKIPIIWYLDGNRWVKKDLFSIDEKIVGSWSFSANYIQAAIDILNSSVE